MHRIFEHGSNSAYIVLESSCQKCVLIKKVLKVADDCQFAFLSKLQINVSVLVL